ncbi:MAG: FAD-dependent oxidoreductase, partial [bacterium]
GGYSAATKLSNVASVLLRSVSPEVADLLSGIGVQDVASLGVAVPSLSLTVPPLAGIIGVSDTFFSAVSRDVIGHPSFRGFSFHFRPQMYSKDSALQKIADVLGMSGMKVPCVAEKTNRVPALRSGHHRLVEEVDRLISGKSLFLTGNYFAGLAIEDCVSRSLREFERFKEMNKVNYPCDSL